MVKPSKNEMQTELENTASLFPVDYIFVPGTCSYDSVDIDFMSYIRGQKLATKSNEIDALSHFADSVYSAGSK